MGIHTCTCVHMRTLAYVSVVVLGYGLHADTCRFSSYICMPACVCMMIRNMRIVHNIYLCYIHLLDHLSCVCPFLHQSQESISSSNWASFLSQLIKVPLLHMHCAGTYLSNHPCTQSILCILYNSVKFSNLDCVS